MTNGAGEQGWRDGASPETKRWVARRQEVEAIAAEDRERALKARAERQRQIEREYRNPVAFGAGLLVLLFLSFAALFIVDRMSCDPHFSDNARRHSCP